MHKQVNVMALRVLVVPALLILGMSMSGCGATAPASTSVPTAPPRAAASPSPSPVVAPATATPRVPAAVTTGWATYRDPHVAFQVPLPPGWRAGSFTSTTPNGPSYYIVQFFPPQSHGQPGVGASSMEPELIEITVVSAPPYISVAGDGDWFAETTPVAIGNTQSTLYDRNDSMDLGVDRMAEVQHGALQFAFSLHVASASASVDVAPTEVNRDTSLYLGMLRGFLLTTN